MALRNSTHSYGSIAKWLHWITALGFLIAYFAVYFRHWFTEPKTALNWSALQLHLSMGISIGVIVALRILWRLMEHQPEPAPGTPAQHFLAHWGHMLLYAIMIIMPLTGYLGTGVNTEFFQLFEIPRFADTALYQQLVTQGLGVDFETFEAPIDFVHKKMGAWVVWVIILGHALAALYHHYVKGDNTLRKMTYMEN